MMRNSIFYLCLLLLCVACRLTDEQELTIGYRPALYLDFSFLDNAGNDVAVERVNAITCCVYDDKGVAVNTAHYSSGMLLNEVHVRALDGVPEGMYTVCSFANRTGNDGQGSGAKTSDSLYFHRDTYFVHRHNELLRYGARLESRFCRVLISVEGDLDPEAGYSLEFAGVPASVSHDGTLLDRPQTLYPELRPAGDELRGNFCFYRMDDPSAVMIRLKAARPDGSSFLFFEQSLGNYLSGIDMHQPDVLIPIRIRLYRGGAFISILDWEEEMEQVVEVGIL